MDNDSHGSFRYGNIPSLAKSIKLDLCCSSRKPEGFFGIDIFSFPGVDLIHDLNTGIPFPDNSCSVVRAHDAIEHFQDGMQAMKEIWRVCEDNALVDILVPSTDGRGAWQDLTHKSFWNNNSFGYWCNDAQWMDYYRGPCLFRPIEWYTTPMSADQVCHVVFKALAVKNAEWLSKFNDR
jgi:SAM-dependent methyltransferase